MKNTIASHYLMITCLLSCPDDTRAQQLGQNLKATEACRRRMGEIQLKKRTGVPYANRSAKSALRRMTLEYHWRSITSTSPLVQIMPLRLCAKMDPTSRDRAKGWPECVEDHAQLWQTYLA